MKYKVHQKAEDIKDIIIEKTGHKIHFTLREIEQTEAQNATKRKEIEAKLKVEKAKLVNIARNNEFIKDMSEEDLNAAYMYYEAQQYITVADDLIKQFNEASKELEEELKDIKKQIPELNVVVVDKKDLDEETDK